MKEKKTKSGMSRIFELSSDHKGLLVVSGALAALAAIASFVPYIAVYYVIRAVISGYKIYPLGSSFSDDQFGGVWQKMCDADTIVWGTPIYWHAMAGPLKVLIDRMYDYQNGELEGKNLAFFQQGGAPRRESLDMNDYIVGRVASLYGMNLVGTSDSAEEIPALRSVIWAVL